MAKSKDAPAAIRIDPLSTDIVTAYLVGKEPLICNRMSEKARQELLMPRGRLTSVDKQTNLKHNPVQEYQASVYRIPDDTCPSLIAMPSTAFKGAMGTAALDLPGAKKAQIGRLVWVRGTYVQIFGTPQLFMSVVRSADMNRTPDIRTRAILPRWACMITVEFVKPLMQAQAVANLIGAAGITAGIGDWRSEKGKGNFGTYRVAYEEDAEFLEILKEGRELQQAALDVPTCYDDETSTLLAWYDDETVRRQQAGKLPKRTKEAA